MRLVPTLAVMGALGLGAWAAKERWIDQMPPDPEFEDRVEAALACASEAVTEGGLRVEQYVAQMGGIMESFHEIARVEGGPVTYCQHGRRYSRCVEESGQGGLDGIPDGGMFTLADLDGDGRIEGVTPNMKQGVNFFQRGVRGMAQACLEGVPNSAIQE